MIETPISFLQIDSPGTGAVLPPGRHAVQGWLMPKLGGIFSDLRVRVASRVFPGLLGFLRTDLAEHFRTGRVHEAAGFQVNVNLDAGPQRLVFEALQIEGIWQEVGELEVAVDPALAPVDFLVPGAPVRGREFGHLLHALLTPPSPDGDLDALAHRLVATSPFPRDLLRPKPPFHGALIEPEAITEETDGFIAVSGHLLHAGVRLRGMSASVDLQVMQPLCYGEASPGAAAQHPRLAAAKACGFSGRVFVPSQLPNPVTLRLYAELADGSSHLVHVARVHRRTGTERSRPFLPDFASRFDNGVTALRRAIAHHQLALVTNAQFDDAVQRLRASLAEPAPRPVPSPAVEIESTFIHSRGVERAAWGLPQEGLIVAGLMTNEQQPYIQSFLQAMYLLRQRHPTLAAECTAVITGDGPGGITHPGVTPTARPLTEADALNLADLTVRPANPGEEALPAGDTVALAEALAHGLYRRRRRIVSGTTAGP